MCVHVLQPLTGERVIHGGGKSRSHKTGEVMGTAESDRTVP